MQSFFITNGEKAYKNLEQTCAAKAYNVLTHALSDIFPELKLNTLRATSDFLNNGLRPIDIATLVCAVEDIIGSTISDDQFAACHTFGGAQRVVAALLIQQHKRATQSRISNRILGVLKNVQKRLLQNIDL